MKDDSYKEFILDQLQDLGVIDCQAMFGGYGLYHSRAFFAILYKDRLYFKTNPADRPAYLERGMKPFRPNAKQTLKSYYEVPIEIIEDSDQLTDWAQKAIARGAEKNFKKEKRK